MSARNRAYDFRTEIPATVKIPLNPKSTDIVVAGRGEPDVHNPGGFTSKVFISTTMYYPASENKELLKDQTERGYRIAGKHGSGNEIALRSPAMASAIQALSRSGWTRN